MIVGGSGMTRELSIFEFAELGKTGSSNFILRG